jgi:hypothetical protein
MLHLLDIPSKFRSFSMFRKINAQQYIIQTTGTVCGRFSYKM